MNFCVWYEGVCQPSNLVEEFPTLEAAEDAAARLNAARRANEPDNHSIFDVRVRVGDEWIPHDDAPTMEARP